MSEEKKNDPKPKPVKVKQDPPAKPTEKPPTGRSDIKADYKGTLPGE